jgi:hypothetical protein
MEMGAGEAATLGGCCWNPGWEWRAARIQLPCWGVVAQYPPMIVRAAVG